MKSQCFFRNVGIKRNGTTRRHNAKGQNSNKMCATLNRLSIHSVLCAINCTPLWEPTNLTRAGNHVFVINDTCLRAVGKNFPAPSVNMLSVSLVLLAVH